MARVDSKDYRKEREERGFGGDGGNLPKFIKLVGQMIVTCLGFAHVRGKGKGTWGVSALLLAVEGESAGSVIQYDMWTTKQVHQFIVSGYGYEAPYENGLPAEGSDPNDFDADPKLLDQMTEIVTCGDQKGKDGKWLPGIPVPARRSVYVRLTTEVDDNPKYVKSKWVDGIKERGEVGPYHVANYRDYRADTANCDKALAWFDGRCEKMVREANKAARERAGSGGGRGDDDRGGRYSDDEVPF